VFRTKPEKAGAWIPRLLIPRIHGSMIIDDSALAHDGPVDLTFSVMSLFEIQFAPFIGFIQNNSVPDSLCGGGILPVAFVAGGKITGLCGAFRESSPNGEFPSLDLFGNSWSASIQIDVPDPDGIHTDLIVNAVTQPPEIVFGSLTVTEVTPEPTSA
jgi:hypothetical protein